jgi:hypothetical protein
MVYALKSVVGAASSADMFDCRFTSPSSSSLVLATMQQLQESGLLQQLPSLLSAVAAGLSAAHTTMARAPMPHAFLPEARGTLTHQLGWGSSVLAPAFRSMPSWLTLTNIWLYNMTSMKQLSATEKQQHAMYDFWSSSHAIHGYG